MKKIGLLGGSFDPPHKGHLYISNEAKKVLSLDEIWWLITPQNPLKINKPATYNERLNNCYKITRKYPIVIKEYEKNINSKYSYITIKYLSNKFTSIKFFWLMGADNLIHFHKWQEWKKITNEISIVVFKRHGYNSNALKSISTKKLANFQTDLQNFKFGNNNFPSWLFINNKEIRISSSEIREQRKNLRIKN